MLKLTVHIFLLSTLMPLALFAAETNADKKEAQRTIQRGAQKWANTCMRCHNMRDPREFNDSEWRAIMLHMRVRAGLTEKDAQDILVFMQNANGH